MVVSQAEAYKALDLLADFTNSSAGLDAAEVVDTYIQQLELTIQRLKYDENGYTQMLKEIK